MGFNTIVVEGRTMPTLPNLPFPLLNYKLREIEDRSIDIYYSIVLFTFNCFRINFSNLSYIIIFESQ